LSENPAPRIITQRQDENCTTARACE